MRNQSRTLRKATNLSIEASLLADARALKVNLSRAAETGIAEAISQARQAQWVKDNREALEASNDYVEKYGLPLAKYRMF